MKKITRRRFMRSAAALATTALTPISKAMALFDLDSPVDLDSPPAVGYFNFNPKPPHPSSLPTVSKVWKRPSTDDNKDTPDAPA